MFRHEINLLHAAGCCYKSFVAHARDDEMGRQRHAIGKPTSINAVQSNMSWVERIKAEDRLDANSRLNLSLLGSPGSYADRPQRLIGGATRPRITKEPALGKLRQLLVNADPKGTGKVDTAELRFLASKSGLDLEDEHTAHLLATSDVRGDGQARYAQFEQAVRHQLAEKSGIPLSSPSSARSTPRSSAHGLPLTTPRDASELIGTSDPHKSALYLRYRKLRMLQPANLQLSAPPTRLSPNTSLHFHENVYRTKNRSLKSWQDFSERQNVLIQRHNSFPGVPTYLDTGISTHQLHFTHGDRPVDPGAFSAQVRLSWRLLCATRSAARANARRMLPRARLRCCFLYVISFPTTLCIRSTSFATAG